MFRFCFLISLVILVKFEAGAEIAKGQKRVRPMLVGEMVPNVVIKDTKNRPISVATVVKSQPTILIFYRGGWCPYCNKHLKEIGEIENELVKKGYQIVAISPDRPEELKKSVSKYNLAYKILSDSQLKAAKAFGVAFKVDRETLQKYKKYNIDLVKASGESHQSLPVPAVFLFGKEGRLKFQYVNPDYTVRLKKQVLLAAADAYRD
jgi:peroxiredoxin